MAAQIYAGMLCLTLVNPASCASTSDEPGAASNQCNALCAGQEALMVPTAGLHKIQMLQELIEQAIPNKGLKLAHDAAGEGAVCKARSAANL